MPKGADLPCQKTIKLLRDMPGLAIVEKVEYWNHFARRRHDLFGFADVIRVSVDGSFELYQVTTRGQMSARRQKILGKPQEGDKNPKEYAEYRFNALGIWLMAGGRVFVHGWGQPGGKHTEWLLTEWEITRDEWEDTFETGVIPRRKKE